MNSKHTSEEKQDILTAYKGGKSVSQLVTETGIPRSTIYAWLADAKILKRKQVLRCVNIAAWKTR